MKALCTAQTALLVLALSAVPVAAQSGRPERPGERRAAAEAEIKTLVAAGQTSRAYEAYDSFASVTGRQDAGLLRPLAEKELWTVVAKSAGDPRLRAEALERLARLGDAQADAELRHMSAERAGLPESLLADGALARLGDAAAVTRLAAAASSPSYRNKAIVAEGLRRAGARDHAQVLVPLLADADYTVRAAAIDALAALDHRESVERIRALLADDQPRVRSRAVLALGRLGDPAGGQAVSALLNRAEPGARAAAAEVSPAAGDRAQWRAAVKETLADPDPLNRVRAAEAIAGDEPAAATAVLVSVAADPDSTPRRAAAAALERLHSTDVALFRRLLGDSSEWVRMHAAGAVLGAARQK